MPDCFEFTYDPESPQWSQHRDWDCSAAATAWFGRSIGWVWEELDVAYEFQLAGIATPALGLLDGTGAGIVRWLQLQPITAINRRMNWSDVLQVAGNCPLIIGSSRWYHWTGVRYVDDSGQLQLANSAPGWGGIWQQMDQVAFDNFGDFYGVQPIGPI